MVFISRTYVSFLGHVLTQWLLCLHVKQQPYNNLVTYNIYLQLCDLQLHDLLLKMLESVEMGQSVKLLNNHSHQE